MEATINYKLNLTLNWRNFKSIKLSILKIYTKVLVRLYVSLFKYSKGGEPDWTPSTTDDITERV